MHINHLVADLIVTRGQKLTKEKSDVFIAIQAVKTKETVPEKERRFCMFSF